MRKIKYFLVILIVLMLTSGVSVFNLSNLNNANAESVGQDSIDISKVKFDELTIDQLANKYVERDNDYVTADGKLPTFYSMIEGDGTAQYKTGLSEKYDTYMLYGQDQDKFAICWSFPSTMAMQTTMSE